MPAPIHPDYNFKVNHKKRDNHYSMNTAASYENMYAKLYKGRKQTTKRGLLTTKQAEYQAPEKCGIFSLFCCPGFPKGIPLAHDFACKV